VQENGGDNGSDMFLLAKDVCVCVCVCVCVFVCACLGGGVD